MARWCNPFLVTTNKTTASVRVGQTRRVLSANITQGDLKQPVNTPQTADLKVTINPQINSDGMIILDINVHIEQFIADTAGSTANTSVKDVKTYAIVADKEVLALGGLIQNTIIDSTTKVPVLGDIPVIGWLFKNKTKTIVKSNLLILISSQIIKPEKAMQTQSFTRDRINGYQEDLAAMHNVQDDRDPVYRAFFKASEQSTEEVFDKFLFERHKPKKVRVSPVLAPATPAENNATEDLFTNNASATDNPMHAQLKKKARTRSSLRDYMSVDAIEAIS